MRRFRALEARHLPPLHRQVDADEVFQVPDGEYADGLVEQPYFEEITAAEKPNKESE